MRPPDAAEPPKNCRSTAVSDVVDKSVLTHENNTEDPRCYASTPSPAPGFSGPDRSPPGPSAAPSDRIVRVYRFLAERQEAQLLRIEAMRDEIRRLLGKS